jgi:hypothetical protein
VLTGENAHGEVVYKRLKLFREQLRVPRRYL